MTEVPGRVSDDVPVKKELGVRNQVLSGGLSTKGVGKLYFRVMVQGGGRRSKIVTKN